MPKHKHERDSYANAIILESWEVQQFQEQKFHERLDAEVESTVAADLERAEEQFLFWFNERAGISAFDPDYFDRLRECENELDYWQELAELA